MNLAQSSHEVVTNPGIPSIGGRLLLSPRSIARSDQNGPSDRGQEGPKSLVNAGDSRYRCPLAPRIREACRIDSRVTT